MCISVDFPIYIYSNPYFISFYKNMACKAEYIRSRVCRFYAENITSGNFFTAKYIMKYRVPQQPM